jgi:hypothetical protein
MHMRGLEAMVTGRGGLKAFRHNPPLEIMLSWYADYNVDHHHLCNTSLTILGLMSPVLI